VSGGPDTPLQLNASRGCPASATGFDVRFSGGNIDGSVLVQDYRPLADLLAAPGQTDSMTTALPFTLETLRAFAGVDVLTRGVYDFDWRCRTRASEASLGDFVGAVTVEASMGNVYGWTRVAPPNKPTVTAVTGPDTAEYGARLIYHVDVKTYRDVPEGSVQLFADARPITSSTPLVGGATDITFGNSLPPGAHSITARYTPSRSDLLPSSSDSDQLQAVTGATQLVLEANRHGSSVTLHATVDPSDLDGIVTFTFPGGSHSVRATGGAASYTVSAAGVRQSFGAKFTPSDSNYVPAMAEGATVSSGPTRSIPVPPTATSSSGASGPTSGGAPSGVGTSGFATSGGGMPNFASGGSPSSASASGRSGSQSQTRVGPAFQSTEHDGMPTVKDAVSFAADSSATPQGALTISVQGIVVDTGSGTASTSYGVDAPIDMSPAGGTVVTLQGGLDATGQYVTMTGSIVPVVVRDSRPGYPGYEVTGTITDLADGSGHVVSARDIGWLPQFVSSSALPNAQSAGDAQLQDGPIVPPADPSTPADDTSVGLDVDRQLFVSPPGVWAGTVTYGAILTMHAPTTTPPGDYQAVLTLTVTGAVL
jgi:hypothetical protein